MNEHNIALDMSKEPSVQPTLYLGQGDRNGTTLIATIYDFGMVPSLSGWTPYLCIRVPRDAGYYEVQGTLSDNVATFEIDETFAATESGKSDIAYVELRAGDAALSTNRFTVIVLPNAGDGIDPSTAYDNGINEAIDRANAAAEAAEGVVLQDVPLMSATVRGGAQLGEGLTIVDGKLTSASSVVPIATTETPGIVKPDGTTVTVDQDGTLHGASTYELPTMDATTKGGAKLGSGLGVDANGALNAEVTQASMTTALGNLQSAILQAQTLLNAIGTVPIANGGTGASTAAGAAANIVNGQAIEPASVTASGEVIATEHSSSGGGDLFPQSYTEHRLTEKANQTAVNALQEAVGTVDVSTDGDLQSQINALGKSVSRIGGNVKSAYIEQDVGNVFAMQINVFGKNKNYVLSVHPREGLYLWNRDTGTNEWHMTP